jgi:non-homologous end joining protein Ku
MPLPFVSCRSGYTSTEKRRSWNCPHTRRTNVAAVKKLVDSTRKGKQLLAPEPEAGNAKVVNIMDALRNSLSQKKKNEAKKTTKRTKAA